jgi:subtilisin family serine protease
VNPLDMVGLTPLMARTSGLPGVTVVLIDGRVAFHPDLAGQGIREISAPHAAGCSDRNTASCAHGTFLAGMLAANRRSGAPAICPGCNFLLRPIFPETTVRNGEVPSTSAEELAAAIVDSVEAGADVLNLSVNMVGFSDRSERRLSDALSFAARRGAIPVVAAANDGSIAESVLTRHRWALPVIACDRAGVPLRNSRLSPSIGKRGIRAPGENITSLGTDGNPMTITGTSAATGFVTGAIALLLSELPGATASDVRFALTRRVPQPRASVVPPLLNAWAAYQYLGTRSEAPAS